MKKILVMDLQLVFYFCFIDIECNYLVEILDAKVVKAQNICLLC
jgi:hypothetical protein